MTKEKTKAEVLLTKRKRKKRLRRFIIIAVVMFYMISRATPILTEQEDRAYRIIQKELVQSLDFEGILFREEKVLSAEERSLSVPEGKRVPSGTIIAPGITTSQAGYPVIGVDGLEGRLQPNRFLGEEPLDYKELSALIQASSPSSDRGVRLVTGFQWGLYTSISPSYIRNYSIREGQRVEIQVFDRVYQGRIEKMTDKSEEYHVVVVSSEISYEVLKHRSVSGKMILRKHLGPWAPHSAILWEEEQPFVVLQTVTGLRKTPVQILAEDDEGVILQGGHLTDLEGNRVRTISLYDEILLYPEEHYKEE